MEMVEEKATQLKLNIKAEIITVTTAEKAIQYRHIGGPTIHINGLDIEKEARISTYFGLCSRRYGTSSTPPERMIEEAFLEVLNNQV